MGFLFYFVVIGYALLFQVFFRQLRIGAALVCSFCFIALFSYYFVLIAGLFKIAAYFIMIGGLLSFVGCLIWHIKKKCLSNRVFSVSLFVFFICCIVFSILSNNAELSTYDDYSFWARAARELFVWGRSYFNGETNIGHWDYNPIFATVQYAITTIFGWKTDYLYYVIIACVFSCLAALLDSISWKYWYLGIIIMISTGLFYPIFGWTYSFSFLGADGPLAFLFATGVVLLAFQNENRMDESLPIILIIALLPAIKLFSGTLFSAVLLLGMLITLIQEFTHNRRNIRKHQFTTFLIAVILMLSMNISWSGYYNFGVATAKYEASSASNVYLASANSASLQKPIFSPEYLFMGNVRDTSISTLFDPDNLSNCLTLTENSISVFLRETLRTNIRISVAAVVFILIFASLVMLKFSNAISRPSIKKALLYSWSGCLIYVFGMFAAYLVQPATANEPIRYIGIAIISVFLSLVGICAANYNKIMLNQLLRLCVTLGLLLLIIASSDFQYLFNVYFKKPQYAYIPGTQATSNYSERLSGRFNNFSSNERILLIDATINNDIEPRLRGGVELVYSYISLPLRVKAIVYPAGTALDRDHSLEYIQSVALSWRASKLVVIANDSEYLKDFSESLGICSDARQPWVFTIIFTDGTMRLTNDQS